jgi:hypothetical protein
MNLLSAIQSYVFSLIILNNIEMNEQGLYTIRSRAESAYHYELEGSRVQIIPNVYDNSIRVEIV